MFNKIMKELFSNPDNENKKQDDFEKRVEAYNAKYMSTGATEQKPQQPAVQKNNNITELSLSNFPSNMLKAVTKTATEFYNKALSDQNVKSHISRLFPHKVPNDEATIVAAQIFKSISFYLLEDEYSSDDLKADVALLKKFIETHENSLLLNVWARFYSKYAGTSALSVLITSGKIQEEDANKVYQDNIEPIIQLIAHELQVDQAKLNEMPAFNQGFDTLVEMTRNANECPQAVKFYEQDPTTFKAIGQIIVQEMTPVVEGIIGGQMKEVEFDTLAVIKPLLASKSVTATSAPSIAKEIFEIMYGILVAGVRNSNPTAFAARAKVFEAVHKKMGEGLEKEVKRRLSLQNNGTPPQESPAPKQKHDDLVMEMANFLADENGDAEGKMLDLLKQAIPDFDPSSERGKTLVAGLTGKVNVESSKDDHLLDIKMNFAATNMSTKLKKTYDSIDLDSIIKISQSNEVFTYFIGEPQSFYDEFKKQTTFRDFAVGATFLMVNNDSSIMGWIEKTFSTANKFKCFCYILGYTQQDELFTNRNALDNIKKTSNLRMNAIIEQESEDGKAENSMSQNEALGILKGMTKDGKAITTANPADNEYINFFPNLDRAYEVMPDCVEYAKKIINIFGELYQLVIEGTRLFVDGDGPLKNNEPMFDDLESMYKHYVFGGLINYHLQSGLYTQPAMFNTVMALCSKPGAKHLKDLIAFSSLKPLLAYAYDKLIVPVMKGEDSTRVMYSFIGAAPSWLQVDIEEHDDLSDEAIITRFLNYARSLQLGLFISSAQTGFLKKIVDDPLDATREIAKEYGDTWVSNNLSNSMMLMKVSGYKNVELANFPNQGPNIALMLLFYMQQLNMNAFPGGKTEYRYPVEDILTFKDPTEMMGAFNGGKAIFEHMI